MGGHCGSGALRDLMHWAGLGWDGPPSEGLVFALGGALGLSYTRSDELLPPIYLVGRGGDLELDLPRRLGGTVSMQATDDPELGWEWIRQRIDRGEPTMIWGDISELPYLRVRLQMSRHDIVVIGYDDEHEIAFVVDNDREDVQEVPYAALARARSSTAFPVPTRHTLYDIAWPNELPSIPAIAAEAFAQSAATMRGSAGGSIIAPSGSAIEATGIDAAHLFARDITTWHEHFGEDALHGVLLGLGAFIEKAGTGGGLFRLLLAKGCSEIARQTGDDAVASLAAVSQNCAAAWSEVARAAVSKDSSVAERSADAAAAAQFLPTVELELVEALEAAAASLHNVGVS